MLRQLYGRVSVPDAVAAELLSPRAPRQVREWLTDRPAWVDVVAVSSERAAAIADSLDLGERAAIALAESLDADLLLIDDAAGRAEARRRNLRVTGTLGVLRVAAELGALDVPEVVERLRATNFYVDQAVLDAAFRPWLGQ